MNESKSSHAPAGLRGALADIGRHPLYWLLAVVPVAAVLEWTHAGPIWVFVAAGAAIIPLAGLMGRATENLSETLGPGIGGLLNATFGNAAELIIAVALLFQGPHMYSYVKASLTGSIIGNILLVLGLAMLTGGLRHSVQHFNRTAASMGATLLALASVGLLMPTIYYYLYRSGAGEAVDLGTVEFLSEEIAGILATIYLLSLVFSLWTHRHLFAGPEDALPKSGESHQPEWSRGTSLTILAGATALVAWMAEMLAGSVEHAAEAAGMNQVFIGMVVVAVVGNAAEHSTAVLMALKNKFDLSMNIAVGSGIQIALFVAPALVFISMLFGYEHPLDLHFTPLETIIVILSVMVLAMVSQDGETHWMEGVMLLGVYVIVALAVFHLPDAVAARQ